MVVLRTKHVSKKLYYKIVKRLDHLFKKDKSYNIARMLSNF